MSQATNFEFIFHAPLISGFIINIKVFKYLYSFKSLTEFYKQKYLYLFNVFNVCVDYNYSNFMGKLSVITNYTRLDGLVRLNMGHGRSD